MALQNDELDRLFGKLLKERRESTGMTQETLARSARISRTSVVNIERGRQGVSLSTLYRIADALNCPPSALLPESALPNELQVLIGHASKEDEEVLAVIKRRMSQEGYA